MSDPSMVPGALRVVLAQINPVVGALGDNARRICAEMQRARRLGAGLVVFPELALTGYPPEDLLLRPSFLAEVQRHLESIAAHTRGDADRSLSVVLGTPWQQETGLRNAAVLLQEGRIAAIYAKQRLPNYSVFDEQRYFQAGTTPCVIDIAGFRFGLSVCEDIWFPEPAAAAQAAGAEILLNLNASPYHRGKAREREQVVTQRVLETGCPVLYVNLTGGQDELVFDGRSFLAVPEVPSIHPLLPAWSTGCAWVDVSRPEDGAARSPLEIRLAGQELDAPGVAAAWATTEASATIAASATTAEEVDPAKDPAKVQPRLAEQQDLHPAADIPPWRDDPEAFDLYQALMLGIRDYVGKNGFSGVLLGLSGGIDSALTAALAVDALGAAAVEAVMMPYRYTAAMSIEDARQEAAALGIDYRELAIEPMVEAFRSGLLATFPDQSEDPQDVTEQNLQSRCRGVLLMALSNRTGKLLLATGNKSEMAVGYATLYGDMAGGLAPLRDVTKHWVYRLARLRNRIHPVIPQRVLERPPSAELAPGQEDAHSLPPYPILDAILEAFVEEERSIQDIVARGFAPAVVERVAGLVLRAEFKRRQAAPGIRVSRRAFGRDRRYPITSGYVRVAGKEAASDPATPTAGCAVTVLSEERA
jgi:NAD+ synthase (glutamine-hydrolysing)